MILLAVETATEACSAALSIDGVITERYCVVGNTHSRLILPMIDELLQEATLKPGDLDGLAFGRGPGSFTGVRIATSVIQGIALGLGIAVVPVSTLAAIAQAYFDHHDNEQVLVAMDARMQEVYWAFYQRDRQGFARLRGSEVVSSALDVPYPEFACVGLGAGWRVYHDQLLPRLAERIITYDADCLPAASAIARLGIQGFTEGLAVPAEQALPVYLRDNVAKKESERNLNPPVQL